MGKERQVMYQLGVNCLSSKACFLESPFCPECIRNYYFSAFLCFRKSLNIKYYKIPIQFYVSLSTLDF